MHTLTCKNIKTIYKPHMTRLPVFTISLKVYLLCTVLPYYVAFVIHPVCEPVSALGHILGYDNRVHLGPSNEIEVILKWPNFLINRLHSPMADEGHETSPHYIC